jgi:hypothetical protein
VLEGDARGLSACCCLFVVWLSPSRARLPFFFGRCCCRCCSRRGVRDRSLLLLLLLLRSLLPYFLFIYHVRLTNVFVLCNLSSIIEFLSSILMCKEKLRLTRLALFEERLVIDLFDRA